MKKSFLVWVMLCGGTLLFAQSLYRIGTVVDGSQTQLNAQRDLFISEINKVSEGEFSLTFPKNKQLNGNFSVETTDKQIARLENDPDVDMVLLIGGISSQLALKKISYVNLLLHLLSTMYLYRV